jgi:hypothetical protein
VDLAALGARGLRIDGAAPIDQAGYALAGAGDFTGDRSSDVLVGSPFSDNGPGSNSGSAFVVNGFNPPPLAPPPPPVPPAAPPPAPVPCTDCDGDGYLATVDCNEANAAIHPGAVDVPGNKVDEDCNGRAAPYPLLDSSIIYAYAYRGRRTTITDLFVRRARAGSTIRITCTGPGCPARPTVRKVAKDARKIDLARFVRKRTLRPPARLEIRVTKRATIGIVKRLTVRAGQRPTQADLCLRPGAAKPTRCPL